MENILGVLGGMGPMASALFYKMITDKTVAAKDQDHINMIILSDASTPDRTEGILSGKGEAAYKSLHDDCKTLESLNVKAICVTCNTAHYYVHQFSDLKVPVISMIREAAKEMGRRCRGKRVAILATDGTIEAGLYQEALREQGVIPYVCGAEGRKATMSLIYDCIKSGKPADKELLAAVDKEIREAGCAGALMACTELSVIKADENLDDFYIDPMEVMAERAIEFMGKQVK